MRRSIPIVLLVILCLSMLLFGPVRGPQPAMAYVSTAITGEVAYVPYRGPDAVWYHQSFEYDTTVTTFDISTACPDIDAYIICYEDATEMIDPDVLATDLGAVTGSQIAVERAVAQGSALQVSMTLIDYIWD